MISEGIKSVLLSPACLACILGGTFIGIVFGSVPGLSAVMAVCLFLPLTYGLTAVNGMSLLCALYIGAISGGLISAILLKIPGTPSSIVTVFDGGPMADRGEGGKAIGTAILVSFIGGIISVVALIFLSPLLAKFALKFTAYEYATCIFFAMTVIAVLTGKQPIMGLISAFFGIFLSTVGSAPLTSVVRFAPTTSSMAGGFSSTTIMIGFFAISEILEYGFNYNKEQKKPIIKTAKIRGYGISFKELIRNTRLLIQSTIIGIIIGILPGIGGNTGAMMSYSAAQVTSKHPERFGKGSIEGLIASETANNATTGGAMVPMLTLGIPGSGTAALLMSGLIIHGVQPGPMIFRTQGVLMYGIFTALALANIVMVIMERSLLPIFVKLLSVPKNILLPIITVMCVLGCFSANHIIFDVICMFVFGVIGFLMRKWKIPISPAVIGFVLAPSFERYLRTGVINTRGNLSRLYTSPICLVFLILSLVFIAIPIIRGVKDSKARKAAVAAGAAPEEDEELQED